MNSGVEPDPIVRALIFGHSHVWPMRRALLSGFSSGVYRPEVLLCGTREFPGGGWVRTTGGQPMLSPVLLSALHTAEIRASDWLISLVGGNYFNQVGMVFVDQEFDFVLARRPELPLNKSATFLPESAVRGVLKQHLDDFLSYAKLLAAHSNPDQTIVVGPPPPASTLEEISSLIAADQKASRGKVRPASPWVRLKLWSLQEEEMREICQMTKLNYCSGAEDVSDDDGFLLREYVRDGVHANFEYANVVLDKIGKLIGRAAEGQGCHYES